MPQEPELVQFKLVLLGEAAVGKSSLILRFTKDAYEENRESTIGAAFMAQQIPLPERNVVVKFEIWDTAGQERYKSLAPMYYRNANAAVVVFDLTSAASLDRAKNWVAELRSQVGESIKIVLVGNKSDLPNKAVDIEDVQTYCKQQDLTYFECSAKTGDNVSLVFHTLAEQMPIDKFLEDKQREEQATINLIQAQQNSCAC